MLKIGAALQIISPGAHAPPRYGQPRRAVETVSIFNTDMELVGSVPARHSCQLFMPSPSVSAKSAEPSVANHIVGARGRKELKSVFDIHKRRCPPCRRRCVDCRQID